MPERSYTKYKVLKPTRRRGVGLVVALAAIALGITAWIWWRHRSNSEPTPEPSEQPISREPERPTPNLKSDLPTTNFIAKATDLVVSSNRPAQVGVESAAPSTKPTQPAPEPSLGPSPTSTTVFVARPPRNAYETQIALARHGFSPGPLDGVFGSQTRAALRAFQEREHLQVTGDLDSATKARLTLSEPSEKNRVISTNDLARLMPVGRTWLEKSQQARLDYETILELLAEEGQAHPNLVRMLNPSVDWTNVTAGISVVIPNVPFPVIRGRAALVRIRLGEKIIQAWDSSSNLLVHFQCSIARNVEKRPVGQLFVEKIALNPNYRFDPEMFPESPEARRLNRKLLIPPGPNNPVGTAWIGLNLTGYGIHGTPRPEDVGRTESHGCFRLANWNADFLAQLVRVGTPVLVEP